MATVASKSVKDFVFEWEGKDRNGRPMRGEIRAVGENQVLATLRRQGIIPGKVKKRRMSSGKRIKPKDIAIFTRQLATMMKAGVPLLQAFDIVGRGATNPRLTKLLGDISIPMMLITLGVSLARLKVVNLRNSVIVSLLRLGIGFVTGAGLIWAFSLSGAVAGEVIISAFDILPMFRRCGTGPQTAWVRRVRSKADPDWQLITDPVAGVEVSVADLLIAGQQVHRFEEKNELFRRISGSNGSTSPYDWEGMLQAVALRIHERGLPASQGELVAEMQEWFVTHSNGNEVPDERSIRRRITPIWRELTKMPVTA